MPQLCAIETCKRASRTLCHCCNQNLCRDHFNEHDDLLNSQLNPLVDEINALSGRLAAISREKISNDSRQQLDQWRNKSYETIDRFYKKKCRELDRYVEENCSKQSNAIADLHLKIRELVDQQATTKNDIETLTSAIRSLEEEMNRIERTPVQVCINALALDDALIEIEQLDAHLFDLSKLSLPPYKTMERPTPSNNSIASNSRFILTYIKPNLCLIDQNLLLIEEKKWSFDISDLCWSSVLNRFIVLDNTSVQLLDEHMRSSGIMLDIQSTDWWCCGCSDKSLYLSRKTWNSTIYEFTLLASIQFVKSWQTNETADHEQRVDSIICNRETIALTINDRSNQTKTVQLRTLDTFITLWSIQMNVYYNTNILRCCLLSDNEWLVSDWYTSHLFHITHDGKIKAVRVHQSSPYNMNLFRSKMLIILTTKRIDLYKSII